ncbi:MAG: hypothetical protein K0S34_1279 [Bacillales bacterium]|jgi:predicted anti-sigma-YlaC factor YlaD|nr:hypothetical protein [Bacillales bacterium]
MKHITDDEILAYINFELSDDMNSNIENHLAICGLCRNQVAFLQELTNEWENPSTTSDTNFADIIMEQLSETKPKKHTNSNSNIKYLHFALAAAATIIFSQLNVIGHIITTSNTAVGYSSKTVYKTSSSIEKGLLYLENFSIKLQFKNGGESK